MELKLQRQTFTAQSTIGTLFFEGKAQCLVLEDVDRKLELDSSKKVYGKTAIPRGRYQIVATFSNRFKRELPLLVGVPGYEGIRIHPGNTAADTDGCLLPGVTNPTPDFVSQSRIAFDLVNRLIHLGLSRGESVWITIQ